MHLLGAIIWRYIAQQQLLPESKVKPLIHYLCTEVIYMSMFLELANHYISLSGAYVKVL